ncbi:hypothetical protein L2E82_18944 [Cichorium intybus]|uniref:Uncharacterized protein n=1 Tax=Cichorium intybus TaxID=13427 RepID=A0ACB9FC39_CICIN|nr:hypothetical protein L2E82_18944 [Cichorium intybus]
MDDCEEYMLLDLDKVTVLELCRLLLHKHIGARRFIHSHNDESLNGTFFRRFVIFVSVVLIKGLKSISKLMECLGSFIEFSFNLWSQYGSFYMLVVSTLRAFESIEMNEKKHPTQAFIFSDQTRDYELICVSFRGTSPFSADDWCTDLNLSWYRLGNIGQVHMGFLKALGLQKKRERCASLPEEIEEDEHAGNTFAYYKIRQILRQKLDENKNSRFIVSGHSLGGALAVLFPAILAFHNEFELLERLEGVYTFGQPRVGDKEFCRYMEDLLGVKRYFRFVYANDIIPRIPFDDSDFLFKHFGYCYYFNSFYKGQVVNEEPNKNYFSIKVIVPMYLNAVFELVRSFVLPYTFGRYYKEGILLLGVRLFGLIVPGASAHCPQDYVNLTRLASPDSFYALQDYYSDE